MKKTTVMFKKVGNITCPQYPQQWAAFVSKLKDGEWFQGIFSKPKKAKTSPQLKYVYGVAYPHLIAWYNDTQGYLYEITANSETIEVEANSETCDLFFKKLFCKRKGIKRFKKAESDIELMGEYIEFLEQISINNFGVPLPEPNREVLNGITK